MTPIENERIIAVIEKYKDTKLRQATLCFYLRGDEILLAMKKRGFAAGKWNGSGGKPNDEDKDIEATAARETFEETNSKPKNLRRVATLNFYFADKPDWNQQVVVYIATKWEGEPSETEEMRPQWFKQTMIPYDDMWEDDPLWLPLVLAGKKVEGDFLFDENQKMVEHQIREI